MENKSTKANRTKLLLSCAGTAVGTALILVIIWLLTKSDNNCAVPDSSSMNTTMSPMTTTDQSPTTSAITTTIAPTLTPPFDHNLRTNVSDDSVFHVWFRASGKGQLGALYARKGGNEANDIVATSSESGDELWFDFHEFAFLHRGELELSWWSGNTKVSYIYVFEPEKVQRDGIRILYISPEAKRPDTASSYHFRPPLGWNNDPAGFSRTHQQNGDRLYHLFYQNNPHNLRWGAMHWGHAVSRDLMHWVHQPIFLRPKDKSQWNGGIFTGSAVEDGSGGLRIYYTEHTNDAHPREFQRSVLTKDMYRPMGPPRDAISHVPTEVADVLTEDFRDPNVFIGPDGGLFMTTSSMFRDGSGGAILLFRQNATLADGGPEGWEFKGIIHKDNRWHMTVSECSGMIPLGDPSLPNTLWALLHSLSGSTDDDGRQFLDTIMVGTFDGQKFTPFFEQLLDMTASTYAYQGFYDPFARESLLIGWLGNWPDAQGDFPAAFTLPRVIKLSENRNYVMIQPHPSIEELRDRQLDTSELRALKLVKLPTTGAVQLKLDVLYWRFKLYGALKLEMKQAGKGPEGMITVQMSQDGLEIVLGWKDSTKQRFIERTARPNALQIFIDVGSVEVFCNGGQWVAAIRIPDEGRVESVQLVGDQSLFIAESAQMWSMKSATTTAETVNNN